MDLGAHAHIFCTALYTTRYEMLVGEVVRVAKHEQFLESEEPATHSTTVFEAEAEVIHYVRILGIYDSVPPVKRRPHMSVAKYTIQISWKGLPTPKMLKHVDFMGVQDAGYCDCALWLYK